MNRWQIIEHHSSDADLYTSLLSLGNGILGVPGNLEETTEQRKGPYINGYYESDTYVYPEALFGHAEEQQVMVELPDFSSIRCYINGQPFSLKEGRVHTSRRVLDMQTGVLQRQIDWEAPDGTKVRIHTQQAVLLQQTSTLLIEYTVTALNRHAEILIETDALVQKQEPFLPQEADPRLTSGIKHAIFSSSPLRIAGKKIYGAFETTTSKLHLFCAAEHRSNMPDAVWECQSPRIRMSSPLRKGQALSFEKYVAYACELDYPVADLKKGANAQLRACMKKSPAELLQTHGELVTNYWNSLGFHIATDANVEQGVLFSLFNILQSSPPSGKRSISAKGLSSNSYDGHYFWDAEIYVFPLLLLTNPQKARQILSYRYATLKEARDRGAQLSLHGALFPWRTISGREGSTYFLAGTAQFHINADIAYAIIQYWETTGDWNFMREKGVEMILETVRIWVDLSADIPNKGICFYAVTGPDEYTAMVNNNYFTNVMARSHLHAAIRVSKHMQQHNPEEFLALSKKIKLGKRELSSWQDIAERIYLPFSTDHGIHLQDEDFLEKPLWNFSTTPLDKYPLLLHFHPLHIYRHQVLKQPDVLLVHTLFPEETPHILRWRDFCYYTPLTTGDSSLSSGILSICAAALGDMNAAWNYFFQTACMDLQNIHRNSNHGLHLACMGSVWTALTQGFAGMRLRKDHVSFLPRIPKKIRELRFRIRVYQTTLIVDISEEHMSYTLQKGRSLRITHFHDPITLSAKKKTVTCSRFPRLTAVCFDLDGVITETAELHYTAWNRLCKDRKIPFDRNINERLRGISRTQSLQIILEAGHITMSKEEMHILTEKKNQYYQELLTKLSPQDIMPGIMQILRALKKNRIYIALVSASRNAHFVLQRLRLYSFFDCISEPGNVLFGKPDPEIFLAAAESLGVTPFNCAGVEDAAAGIQAIRHAGMFAVGIGKSAKAAHWPLNATSGLTFPLLQQQFALFAKKQAGIHLPIEYPQIYH